MIFIIAKRFFLVKLVPIVKMLDLGGANRSIEYLERKGRE